MSNLLEYAKRELESIGGGDDEMQQMMNADILELVGVFSNQGHSGFSASYAINALTRLLDFKPLKPLTGEDEEWAEPNGGTTQQNKRCSAVFRENYDNSTAHYIDGKVFSDDGGKTWWSGKGSSIPVTFPFVIPENPERIILETKMD